MKQFTTPNLSMTLDDQFRCTSIKSKVPVEILVDQEKQTVSVRSENQNEPEALVYNFPEKTVDVFYSSKPVKPLLPANIITGVFIIGSKF